jgi:hypothetical protein
MTARVATHNVMKSRRLKLSLKYRSSLSTGQGEQTASTKIAVQEGPWNCRLDIKSPTYMQLCTEFEPPKKHRKQKYKFRLQCMYSTTTFQSH